MKGLKKILSIGCAVLTLASSMSFINVSADPPTVFKNGSRTQNEIKNNRKQLMVSKLIGTAEI